MAFLPLFPIETIQNNTNMNGSWLPEVTHRNIQLYEEFGGKGQVTEALSHN